MSAEGSIVANYAVKITDKDNVLINEINEPTNLNFAVENKKTINLKIIDTKAGRKGIVANWHINGEAAKKDSVVAVDLSQTGKYEIVIRGINDSVLIFNDHYTDTLMMVNLSVVDKPTVNVTLNASATYNTGTYYTGQFGFDANTPQQVKKAKSDYAALPADAYMSFIGGQQAAQMEMDVTFGTLPKNYSITIKNSGELTITPNSFSETDLKNSKDKRFDFSIKPGTQSIENGKIQIVGSDGTQTTTLYEINYSVKNKDNLIQRDVKLLYVIMEDKDTLQHLTEAYKMKVEKQLNEFSYNQAFTQWNVAIDTVDIRNILKKQKYFSTLESEYKAIANVCDNFAANTECNKNLMALLKKYGYTQNQSGYDQCIADINAFNHSDELTLCSLISTDMISTDADDYLYERYKNRATQNSYIAFLVNKKQFSNQAANVPGAAAPSGFQSIFLFDQIQDDDNLHIFTHELGHSLGLKHPFEEFGTPYGNTGNYMDYGRLDYMFWYWQWNFIQNSQPGMIVLKEKK